MSYGGGEEILLARGLSSGRHTVTLAPGSGIRLAVDSLTVEGRRPFLPWLAAVGAAILAVLLVSAFVLAVRRRRPWYERSRAG
jgi:hypothetical protein